MKRKFLWGLSALLLMVGGVAASIYCEEDVIGWDWSLAVGNNTGRYYTVNTIDLNCERLLVTGIDDCVFYHDTRWDCHFSGNVWSSINYDSHTHDLMCNQSFRVQNERVALGFPCLSCTTRVEVTTWIHKGAMLIVNQPVPPNYSGTITPNPKSRIFKCGPSAPVGGGGGGSQP